MKILITFKNLILNQKNKLTKWEEEQIEIGLKDLDSGKRIPHKTVMKKINQILK